MNHLLCTECNGAATPQHPLCITVPCGHLIHEECLAFLKKHAKLIRRGQPIALLAPPHSDAAHCPDCNAEVFRAVKMFLDAPGTSSVSTQNRVAHLQRKLLMRMNESIDNTKEVTAAGSSCALRFQEINGLRGALVALQAALAGLDQIQPRQQPPTLQDENRAIASMTQHELSWLVRDLHSRTAVEKSKLEGAQKLLATKKHRYASMKAEYDAQRIMTAKAKSARQAATVHLDPVQVRPGTHLLGCAPEPAPSHSAAVDDVIDVDAEETDDDSDVEVIAVVPRVQVKPEARSTPLRPVPTRVLPSYDVGSGRSLMDFPRAADATFQGVITQYLQ
jgi:hypothetical protein